MSEQASTETKPKNAFIVRVKKDPSVALKENVIGIGWGKVEGMDKFAAEQLNWEQVKTHIRNAYENSGHTLSGGKLGNITGNIWKFSMEGKGGDSMSIGDYVLMPVGKGFHLGIVKSGVKRCKEEWAEKADLKWQRDVEWLTKDKAISRDAASRRLQNRMKIRQTCGNCKDLLCDIAEANLNRTKELFNTRAKNAIRETITSIVKTYVGNDQLENLVAKLCQKSGASKADTLPKKSSKEGDADVQADYPVFIGNTEHFVRVLYQAKNHTGTTGTTGVQQLIDRICDLESNDRDKESVIAYKGCLITCAQNVDDAAVKLAEDHSIDILRLDDLVEWILDAGLSDLNV